MFCIAWLALTTNISVPTTAFVLVMWLWVEHAHLDPSLVILLVNFASCILNSSLRDSSLVMSSLRKCLVNYSSRWIRINTDRVSLVNLGSSSGIETASTKAEREET